jgi:hypothetical protein
MKMRKSKNQLLNEEISRYKAELAAKDVTIGQWQARLYSLQMEMDAYRKAQHHSLQVFRDFYEKEKTDFIHHNIKFIETISQVNGLDARLSELEQWTRADEDRIYARIEALEKKLSMGKNI